MTNFIGIDPGASGGMACIKDAYLPEIVNFKHATESDIAQAISSWHSGGDCFAVLERVWASRGKGDRTMGAATMFSFGQNYGFIRGCLIAFKIPFEEVLPAKWQAEFSLKRTDTNESDTDKKNRHKAKAQQLFPTMKTTHATADALLITEYGRRLRTPLYTAQNRV
jgi:crossover junction endodeoxyribonuclease RuvC